MLGARWLVTGELDPWRLNLHTKWGREGNGMLGRGPAQRKQIKKKKKNIVAPHFNQFFLSNIRKQKKFSIIFPLLSLNFWIGNCAASWNWNLCITPFLLIRNAGASTRISKVPGCTTETIGLLTTNF
jgi:hypothetical protein